jgi:DNA-binding GntR family transcriptional regulator
MNVMSQEILKRACMRDRIRDVLVVRILDGTYAPGTQLKELSLAREFNVSQAPIREALRGLEGSGLVTSERFRGTRVCGTDYAEMRESYELRIMLEVRSVKVAAPYAPELLGRFEECLIEMEGAVEANDSERYIDAALRFHRCLVEGSRNRTFLSVWDSLLWDIRGRITLRRQAERGQSFRSLTALHRDLMTRLRAQDAEGAAEQVSCILERIASTTEEAKAVLFGQTTGKAVDASSVVTS